MNPVPTAESETAERTEAASGFRQWSAPTSLRGPRQPSSSGQPQVSRAAAIPFSFQPGVLGRLPPVPLLGHQESVQPSTTRLTVPIQPSAEGTSRGSASIPCSFYMKTGNCAFGTECKFDHPLDQPATQYNSLGLPIRPGEPDCAYYLRNLHCGYGASCKFNHSEPVYSWMPAPMVDGMGMLIPPVGLPLTYSPLPRTQAAVVSENAMLPHMSQTQLPLAGHIPVPGMGAQLAPYMAAQQLPQAALVPMPLQTLHLGHPMFQQMPQIGGPPEGGLPTAMWSVPRAVGAITSGGVFPAMPPAPVGIHPMGLQRGAGSQRGVSDGGSVERQQTLQLLPEMQRALQTTDVSGTTRSQDSRPRRRSRNRPINQSMDQGSMLGGRKDRVFDMAEQPEVDAPNSASGNSKPVGLEGLSLEPRPPRRQLPNV